MKRKNKFIDTLISSKEDNININPPSDKNIINSNTSQNKKEAEKINYSFQETNKKNIINGLKLKSFNEIQIDDILEALIKNTISERTHLMVERSNLNIQETSKIDKDLPSSKKLGINQGISQENKKMENINSNSKNKNSFIIKTENSKRKNYNKNKINYNCAKMYVNTSSEKDRNYCLNSNDDINLNKTASECNGKIANFKKYRNVLHITSIDNTIESKKINIKYVNKF